MDNKWVEPKGFAGEGAPDTDKWWLTSDIHGDINAKGKVAPTIDKGGLSISAWTALPPTKAYDVDWGKVQTPQDLIAIVRSIYPNIKLNITDDAYEKVKHLLKES